MAPDHGLAPRPTLPIEQSIQPGISLLTPTIARPPRVWLARVCLFLEASLFAGLLPLLPYLTRHTTNPEQLTGLGLGAYGVAAFAVSPAAGLWVDRRGARGAVFLGTLSLATGSLLLGIRSMLPFVVGRLFEGMAAGFLWTAAMALVGKERQERGGQLGVLFGWAGAGYVLGPGLAGWTAEILSPITMLWMVAAGSAAVASFVLLSGPAFGGAPGGPILRLSGWRPSVTLLTPLMSTILVVLALGLMQVLLPFRLSRDLGLRIGSLGGVLLLYESFFMVGEVVGGRLSDRVGRLVPIGGGMVLLGLALPFAELSDDLTALLGSAFLVAWGIGAAGAASVSLFADVWEDRSLPGTGPATAFGVFNALWSIGYVAGTAGGGFILTAQRPMLGIAVMSVAAGAAGLGVLLAGWRAQRFRSGNGIIDHQSC